MGRFEKQPDNPRVRGEISRAAENALWGVVEDLENLQQHVLRSLQEDIKRLQGEKNRLSDEIQRLLDEKEQLQQVRQITEQQVLIRQLAEALAKHISSQLQSSLAALGNQTIERTSIERAALKSQESNSTVETVNNQKIEQLLGALDNTLTVTFNSLQQEIKNYQSNIYQQLSLMQSQQQQGEIILTELIHRLSGLEKTVEESSLKVVTVSPTTVLQASEQAIKASSPTVLQLTEPHKNGYVERSPQLVEVASKPAEPISVLSPLSESEITPTPVENKPAEPISVLSPLSESEITPTPVENKPAEPISVLSPLSESEITPTPVENKPAEPISVLSPLSESEITPEPLVSSTEITATPVENKPAEPISVLSPLSESEITPTPVENKPAEPISVLSPLSESEITPTPVENKPAEPISVLSPLSESEITPEPVVSSTEITATPQQHKPAEPISVLSPLSESEITPTPVENKPAEPISVLSPLSETEITPEPVVSSTEITPTPVENKPAEPISVLSPLSETEITPEPVVSSTEITPTIIENKPAEPISVLSPLSETEITPEPVVSSTEITPTIIENKPAEPISIGAPELSQRKTRTEPTALSRRQKTTPTAPTRSTSTNLSAIQIGFLLVVLSTVLSSLYNVAIKVLFQEGSQMLGVTVYGLLLPTFGNTIFILMLRLLVVVPLMLLLAPMMHQNVWQDIQNLFASARAKTTASDGKTEKVWQLAIASGCCLFISQVLVYIAISQIATGAAIALFFIYPVISAMLSWLLFRERPSLLRAGAMGALFCGELLVLAGASSSTTGDVSLGSSAAIFSGLAFSAYVIMTRLCANKVHPVSLTLIHFTTMLLLSVICLIIPLPSDWSLNIDTYKLLEIILSAFILGVLTLCGYVLNNLGIRQLGASKAAIIGASVPILTAIFAGLIIQDSLEILQIFGVLVVTFSAAAFGFEAMQNQVKSSGSAN